MNEQIKKLIEQAGIESYQAKLLVNTDEEGKVSSKWEIPLEKFAELIVRECADIARDVGFWTTPEDWALDKCNEVEQRIRHRFGVEDGPAECTNDIKIY